MSIGELSTAETISNKPPIPYDLNNFGINIAQIAYPEEFSPDVREYYLKAWSDDVIAVVGEFVPEDASKVISTIDALRTNHDATFRELFKLVSSKVSGPVRRKFEEPVFEAIKQSLHNLGGLFADNANLDKIMLLLCGYANGELPKRKPREQ